MPAMQHFARQALGLGEKPHSSITDWVEVLTGPGIEEEAYDGIPELVDSINIQPAAGPAEASRALRKKLKHGNAHQQYRSLVILKALVENCGEKFKTSFADGQLTDALKHIASDPDGHYDKRVRKKLRLVLQSWHDQFKSDPSMSVVANLYSQCKADKDWGEHQAALVFGVDGGAVKRRQEQERQAKEEKARKKQEEEERKRAKHKPAPRAPFNFEKEKPKVLSSIVEASQASSNLVNAMQLVNRETDSIQSNERVQECLTSAKLVRKQVVRYIQLVENEEIIGTLIEVNERIVSALEMYDNICNAARDATGLEAGLSTVQITTSTNEVNKLQDKQRAAVARAKLHGSRDQDDSHLHPDLQDLNFGSIGESAGNLAAPLQPSTNSADLSDEGNDARASLSDFSDYESSDEGNRGTSTSWRGHVNVSDDSDDGTAAIKVQDDPFADPFADEVAVGPSKKW
ncbi:hypothetical protein C8J56DRAFT_918021 [Mycena floridula]|nr:hypothetical protein C8J56DRAFT_918021 [Mycena floridula]